MRNKKTFFLIVISISIFLLVAYSFANDSDTKGQNPVKYLYYNAGPFYVYCKKHACPKCGTKLKTAYDSVVVNSDSPEAKDYDFSTASGDFYLTGDVEFRIVCFRCPMCEFKISFDEMKKPEEEK